MAFNRATAQDASRRFPGNVRCATAHALAGFLLRGLDCGAFGEADISDRCDLDRADLRALGDARRYPQNDQR